MEKIVFLHARYNIEHRVPAKSGCHRRVKDLLSRGNPGRELETGMIMGE